MPVVIALHNVLLAIRITPEHISWASSRYVKLRVAHAPGMPGTFSPPPRISDLDMHHGTCDTHELWCIPGSLTSGFPWSGWLGKHSQHSRRMRNPQFYVSGKRSMKFICTAAEPMCVCMHVHVSQTDLNYIANILWKQIKWMIWWCNFTHFTPRPSTDGKRAPITAIGWPDNWLKL